jgi:hypothetical protein
LQEKTLAKQLHFLLGGNKMKKRILATFLLVVMAAVFVMGGLPRSASMLQARSNDGFVMITKAPPNNSMVRGATRQLQASVLWLFREVGVYNSPHNASPGINWQTSNSTVATVSATGLVTARATGSVTITASSTQTSAAPASITLHVAPDILPRSSWTTAAHGRPLRGRTPQRVIFHHNAGQVFTSTNQTDAMRYIQGFGGSFGGLYHFAIDPAGRIWELIPMTHRGAHTGSAGGVLYDDDIGIAFLGNYHPYHSEFNRYGSTNPQQLTAAQRTAAEQLTRWLVHYFNMNTVIEPPANQARPRVHTPVAMHYDLAARDCPGNNVAPWIRNTLRPQINTWVRSRR